MGKELQRSINGEFEGSGCIRTSLNLIVAKNSSGRRPPCTKITDCPESVTSLSTCRTLSRQNRANLEELKTCEICAVFLHNDVSPESRANAYKNKISKTSGVTRPRRLPLQTNIAQAGMIVGYLDGPSQ